MNKPGILRFSFSAAVFVALAGAGINLSSKSNASVKDSPIRLVLNVPAHRIYVFENGKNTRTFKVSVGMVGHQTPAGSYKITQAIWNPWWHPPASPWAEGRKPEPPGVNNPMGRVKLNFAPLLYIHGTNDRVALGDPASHGCVRLLNEDLIEFARLVQSYATPGIDKQLAQLAETPEATKEFNFKMAIPFEVVYNVAAINNDFLYIYPDVYKKVRPAEFDAQVKDVLETNGIDLALVDHERLADLLHQARTHRVSIPLDELVSAAPAPSAKSVAAKSASSEKRVKPKAGASAKGSN